MKWFFNLKRWIRNLIAVTAWFPLFVFAGVVGGAAGGHGEDVQTWQAVIILLLLAVGIAFTVFAVQARRRETRAEREAQSTKVPQPQAPARGAGVITMSEGAIKSRVLSFPYFTKAVGVTFNNCQEWIQKSEVGDPLTIKHHPTDEYEENTDIINARTHKRIGHINADLAWELLGEFDEHFVLDGVITDITGGGDGQKFGCNIEITGEHFDDE